MPDDKIHFNYVNKAVVKVDAKAIVTGKPVYTDDLAPSACLVVKLLRSPHAFARIKSIQTDSAMKIPGVERIFTYKDVPQSRFTCAGQTYPEPSPYDRLILDEWVRYVGDPVAIVAAADEKSALKALSMIRVEYDVQEPLLDFEKALESPIRVHPEENYHVNLEIGNEVSRNLCASDTFNYNNVDEIFPECDVVVENTFYIQAQEQSMMENFATYTFLDHNSRLNVVTSTQVPFHVRRILSRALSIPKQQIKVVKPRIGGGFGAKQTAVSEFYPAFVTLMTGKPAKLVFTRKESASCSNSRHMMRIHVKAGSDNEGNILALDVDTLSNSGAYGEHGPTTVGLSGHKSIPIYNHAKASRFTYNVVYSNLMPGGAFRGYGATQGFFAVESSINFLAAKLGMDPVALREKNIVRVGEIMPAYYGEKLNSSTLDRCIKKGREMIGWDQYYPYRIMPDKKVRSVGMAVAMQGSGISSVDTASIDIRLNDDGFYTLMTGATDMGTGCDTILSQMAADCLDCNMNRIIVQGVDTDHSPYDTGSYASSTTYVTGMAVVKAAADLKAKMTGRAAEMFGLPASEVEFDGEQFSDRSGIHRISLDEFAQKQAAGFGISLIGTATNTSPVSPPPFIAGFVLIETDPATGKVSVLDMVGVVDCGTVINRNLARVQTEGGLLQGIGLALYENVCYDRDGRMITDSFLQYKVPTRPDVPSIRVAFEESYEPTGPFGAKSIGEVVINTPAPAIAGALKNAFGIELTRLPFTPERVWEAIREKS